jgi:cobalt/nickel transport system permease protein
MHIPDNYLSPASCAVMGAAVAPILAVAARKVGKEVSKERIPLLGIGAAFSFLIMMFNIPLPGGTTGHAVGGTLLAAVLGPWAACVSIAIALLLQALLFGDGGVLAFGANCFNMAFVMPFLGWLVYRLIRDRAKGLGGELAGIAVGSYVGINFAALCAAVELGLQPYLFRTAGGLPMYFPFPLAISIPAMMIPHLAVAGVAEAVFAVSIFSFIKKVSPDTIIEGAHAKVKPLYGLLGGLALLSPLGLIAAGTAWGEWEVEEIARVASGGQTLGFVPEGMSGGFSLKTLLPDYSLDGVPDIVGYIISAVAGVAVLVIAFKLISLLKKEVKA